MSLIGPRAQAPEQVARYQDWQRQRLLIDPGMTGLWFSNGHTDLTFDEMVRLDLFYAEHWSVWLDLKILLRTFVALLQGVRTDESTNTLPIRWPSIRSA